MQDEQSTLSWLKAITLRLLQVTPFRSTQAVFYTLVSQTALMVGMLLPIKVVMLLGMDTIPSFMPEFVQAWSVETLILSLSGLAVVFFLIYLAGDRLATDVINSSARDIVQQAGKVVLFENQEQLATNTYKKIITAVAGIIFTLAVVGLLGFVYPSVAIALVILIILSAPLLPYLMARAQKENQPQLLNQSLHNINNIGFFLLFALIVVDHLYFAAPSILFTIASIILMRQATGKLVSSVADLANTTYQRDKISALFFHNHILLNATPVQSEGVWALLEEEKRRQLLDYALAQAGWLDTSQCNYSVRWVQTGTPDIFSLWLTEGETGDQCIVKIFGKSRESQCVHEATLLTSPTELGSTAPHLLHTGSFEGYRINVLGIPAGFSALENREEFHDLQHDFNQQLAACSPSPDITAPYLRSHPLLSQKLTDELVRPVLLACTNEKRESLSFFTEHLPLLRSKLAALPVVLQNPAITPHTTQTNAEGAVLCWHWGQWSIDVLGCAFPANPKGMKLITATLERLRENDPNSELPPVNDVELASFSNALFYCLNSQRFNDALELLPQINERLA